MTVMPREDAEWTVDDLGRLPDDGLRYELPDGILLVSPAPTRGSSEGRIRIGHLLRDECPEGLEVVAAPLDTQPETRTSLQPDVLVPGDRDEPPITAYEIQDGRHVMIGEAAGGTP